MAKSKVTGKKAASNASKTLKSDSSASKSKSAAGSALSQSKAPKKTTSDKCRLSTMRVHTQTHSILP